MSYKNLIVYMALGLLAVLSACNGTSAQEEVYNHLEKAVTLEETFQQQQEPIAELEQKEQELYSEIIDLGMDELDKIKELSNEAIGVIEERSEKIELEKESIDSSKGEFVQIEPLIEDIESENAQSKASEMYEVMMNRYKAYSDLYSVYNESLTLEKELYTMLQEDDIEQEDITEQINKINSSYQEVIEANELFNEYTVEYNALKKEFYDVAEISVEYEGDSPTSGEEDTDESEND
ncbi:YkyA family protein [Virgibacillus byunsanensis]|uniref:YkyA family protein n=1 Tax=Virgibacillus byunsanensis TaxID=570945 RepID=A0ABW3LJZ6_9BACI